MHLNLSNSSEDSNVSISGNDLLLMKLMAFKIYLIISVSNFIAIEQSLHVG